MESHEKIDFNPKKSIKNPASPSSTTTTPTKIQLIELNWHKNLQIYYIINNLSTLCVFILLSKCLYTLNPNITAIILLITSYTFLTILSISTIYFASPASYSRTKYELIEYLKNMPLCYFTFYHFTKINYLKSTNSFDYNLLLLSTIYFSLQTCVNCILIEIKAESLLSIKFLNMLFLFLFRYFFFVAKLMSSVLFLSTFNDANLRSFLLRNSSAYDLDAIEVTLFKHIYTFSTVYLIGLFLVYLVWYVRQFKKRDHQILRATFESYKMLIDYNARYFATNRARFIFMLLQLLAHVSLAYFWYYRAILVFDKARARITLIGLLLTRQNQFKVLVSLYEIEEKLKTRQFELVFVLGSIFIAILAQYIYYTYYCIKSDDQQNLSFKLFEKPELARDLNVRYVKATESRRKSQEYQENLKFDSFSLDTYKQSTSISSWVTSSASTSSSSGIFNVNNFNPNHHHHHDKSSLDCSTCCTTMDRYIFDSDVFDSCRIMNSNQIKLGRNGGLNYESSSGVATSASSDEDSSLSSIYNDLSYYCQHESASRWQPANLVEKRKKENEMDNNNEKRESGGATTLVNVRGGGSDLAGSNFYDKVLVWIKNSAANGEVAEIAAANSRSNNNSQSWHQPYQQTNVNNFQGSFENTESTIKTDRSNFTYFI